MRDAKVEEIEHLSDSDSEEQDTEQPRYTVGIFPNNQAPTYLHFTGKQVNNFLVLFILVRKCLIFKKKMFIYIL